VAPGRVARRRPQSAPADGSSEVRAALDALRLIVQALRLGARDGERRSGLSSAQLFALQQVAAHPGASINDVAALTFTHQSSVSVVIERLVAQRFVARVAASHDRRRRHLELTAAGRRALQRAPAAVQEKLVAAIAELPETERRALARALAMVARVVAPAGAAAHVPMLFEETVHDGAASRAANQSVVRKNGRRG
jgi:DNA-binding MarR family transcriptional regulator